MPWEWELFKPRTAAVISSAPARAVLAEIEQLDRAAIRSLAGKSGGGDA